MVFTQYGGNDLQCVLKCPTAFWTHVLSSWTCFRETRLWKFVLWICWCHFQYSLFVIRSEVPTAVDTKVIVFWDVRFCGLEETYQNVRGTGAAIFRPKEKSTYAAYVCVFQPHRPIITSTFIKCMAKMAGYVWRWWHFWLLSSVFSRKIWNSRFQEKK